MITSTWPARSTTAAEVLNPFALHSASAASAIVFAIARERLRCVTTPCAMRRPDQLTAIPIPTKAFNLSDMTPPLGSSVTVSERSLALDSKLVWACEQQKVLRYGPSVRRSLRVGPSFRITGRPEIGRAH